MSSFLVSWYCSFLKRRRLSWETPVGESQEQIGRLGLHNGNTLMTQLDNWTLCRKYSSSHQNIKLLPSFGKVDFSIDQVGISNLNKSQVLEDRDVKIDWHWRWGIFGVWMYKIQNTKCKKEIHLVVHMSSPPGGRGRCMGCKVGWPPQVRACQQSSWLGFL